MSEYEMDEDAFLSMADGDEYFDYLHEINDELELILDVWNKISESNDFNSYVYIQLTGIIKYVKNRLFPLYLTFFGHDENFVNDLYPEYMDIHLMSLFLLDKLQYQLDEAIIKWDMTEAIVVDELTNLGTINYYINLINVQLTLLHQVFTAKIKLMEGTISQKQFDLKIDKIHRSLDI